MGLATVPSLMGSGLGMIEVIGKGSCGLSRLGSVLLVADAGGEGRRLVFPPPGTPRCLSPEIAAVMLYVVRHGLRLLAGSRSRWIHSVSANERILDASFYVTFALSQRSAKKRRLFSPTRIDLGSTSGRPARTSSLSCGQAFNAQGTYLSEC